MIFYIEHYICPYNWFTLVYFYIFLLAIHPLISYNKNDNDTLKGSNRHKVCIPGVNTVCPTDPPGVEMVRLLLQRHFCNKSLF